MKRYLLSICCLFLCTSSSGQGYPRFSKPIKIVDEETYVFGDKVLTVTLEDKNLKGLFDLGIFNPDVIYGEQTVMKPQDSAKDGIFNFLRTDSIAICCFVELKSKDPRTKKYTFWHFSIGVANPKEYSIEFYNEKANSGTSLVDFVAGARMKSFKFVTIII